MTDTREAALPAWAVVSPRRQAHVERVVATLDGWATAMCLAPAEHQRWLRAGWLHDALRDAPPDALRALAPDAEGPPVLWHGPASAARARADGEHDAALLDAVSYHSLGDAGWDACGDALYCADFLEPGRGFLVEERATLRDRFPTDPAGVLHDVVRLRLQYTLVQGWPIHPRTALLWNRTLGPDAAERGD